MEIASRLWDVYVFEGDEILVQAAVAVLARLEGKLYGSKEEILDVLVRGGVYELGREDEFMRCVREMGQTEGGGETRRPASW